MHVMMVFYVYIRRLMRYRIHSFKHILTLANSDPERNRSLANSDPKPIRTLANSDPILKKSLFNSDLDFPGSELTMVEARISQGPNCPRSESSTAAV